MEPEVINGIFSVVLAIISLVASTGWIINRHQRKQEVEGLKVDVRQKYLTCDGISFASELAKRFYKYYLISLEDGKTEDAFYAVIHAAWACDDKGDTENAKHCRTVAIPLAAALIDKNP